MPSAPVKRPWLSGSARQLADEHRQPTYIVTRTDDLGPNDMILFASEIEDADLPQILLGFTPRVAPAGTPSAE